jgi:formylglycine-generating enzyme required for sulfatase activity
MSGNVWEWSRSHYYRDYPYDPDDGREDLEAGNDVWRALRGGSAWNDADTVRCTVSLGLNPHIFFGTFGFRVVVSPISSSL